MCRGVCGLDLNPQGRQLIDDYYFRKICARNKKKHLKKSFEKTNAGLRGLPTPEECCKLEPSTNSGAHATPGPKPNARSVTERRRLRLFLCFATVYTVLRPQIIRLIQEIPASNQRPRHWMSLTTEKMNELSLSK